MLYVNPYELCDQTVTVYHSEGDTITRTVYTRAFLDFKKTQNVENTGSQEVNGCLLVIPGDKQACQVGDKVLYGVGEHVPADAAKWWRTFIPAKVDGLVVVKHVDVKRFNNKIVHTEAGG